MVARQLWLRVQDCCIIGRSAFQASCRSCPPLTGESHREERADMEMANHVGVNLDPDEVDGQAGAKLD
jgi:hypothetical protein